MSYEHEMFDWQNEGFEPSDELKKAGFQAGYKPPASIFNYFWHKASEAIKELQTKSFANLGDNVITSVEDDTVANWCALGSGYSRFNSSGVVIGKPANYGIILSYVGNNEVYQVWRTMDKGPTYQRSGNTANGWTGWAKIYDEANKPVLTTSDIGRSVVVGCGANGVAGWYPIGKIACAGKNFFTYNVQLSILGNGSRGGGILDIFTRVEETAGVLNTEVSHMTFLGKSSQIVPEYFAIDMSTGDAILYVYCQSKYSRYHITVLSEAYGTSSNGTGENFIKLSGNYTDDPVLYTNYVASITPALVAQGAPIDKHASKHARGGKDALSVKDIAFIGLNHVTAAMSDTPATWKALKTGYAYYNLANQITDQKNQYGLLLNYVHDEEVHQVWRGMPLGPTYERSGNANGWGSSWVKQYDEAHKPTPKELGAAYSQRSVMIGSGSTVVDGWYKVGTIDISKATYITYSVMLAVLSNATRGGGILRLSLRTENVIGELNLNDSELTWIAKDNNLGEDIFAIDASDGKTATLYCKINANYQQYHISIISEKCGTYDLADDDAKQYLKLGRNHGESSVVTAVASITQTITSKDAAKYIETSNISDVYDESSIASGFAITGTTVKKDNINGICFFRTAVRIENGTFKANTWNEVGCLRSGFAPVLHNALACTGKFSPQFQITSNGALQIRFFEDCTITETHIYYVTGFWFI